MLLCFSDLFGVAVDLTINSTNYYIIVVFNKGKEKLFKSDNLVIILCIAL